MKKTSPTYIRKVSRLSKYSNLFILLIFKVTFLPNGELKKVPPYTLYEISHGKYFPYHCNKVIFVGSAELNSKQGEICWKSPSPTWEIYIYI